MQKKTNTQQKLRKKREANKLNSYETYEEMGEK